MPATLCAAIGLNITIIKIDRDQVMQQFAPASGLASMMHFINARCAFKEGTFIREELMAFAFECWLRDTRNLGLRYDPDRFRSLFLAACPASVRREPLHNFYVYVNVHLRRSDP
jgi:hypothetical protein